MIRCIEWVCWAVLRTAHEKRGGLCWFCVCTIVFITLEIICEGAVSNGITNIMSFDSIVDHRLRATVPEGVFYLGGRLLVGEQFVVSKVPQDHWVTVGLVGDRLTPSLKVLIVVDRLDTIRLGRVFISGFRHISS